MRRALFMLGLLSVVALASCSIKEELQEEFSVSRFCGTIEQLVPDASTRAFATYDEANKKYHIYWNADDRVSIFEEGTFNREYRFIGKDGAPSGRFDRVGEDPAHIIDDPINTDYQYAIFPYDEIMNCCEEDGTLQVYFPKVQEFYDDPRGVGARMLMVARDEEGNFSFKHVGSYIGVTLKGEGVSVKSFSFQGNNSEIVAGDPYVTFNDNDEPVVAFSETSSYNSTVVSMIFENPVELTADEQEFWIVVPSITLSKGYTLTVTDANGGVFQKKTTDSFTMKRKTFYHNRATVVPTVPVTGVTVAPKTLELTVDDESTLTATVSPDNATDKSVTWESSNTAVATVNASGKVTAIAAGTATITVTTVDGGKTATCAVTVADKVVPVESVSLDKETLDMFVGDAPVALTATVSPDNATNKNVTWESSNTNVATVDAAGKVSAVAAGTATITVTTEDGNETATCAVNVKVHVESVSLDKETLAMYIGDDPVTLIATVTPDNAADKSVTWASDKPEFATVDANGKVSAVAAGTATITVTTVDGGKTASCVVTVKNVVTYALAIDPATGAEVDAGSTVTFKLLLTTITNGEAGETAVDVAADATWTSSNTAIATIAAGTATGVKEGNVTITAKYTDPAGNEWNLTAPLTVNKKPDQPGDDVPIGGGGSF